MRLILGSAAADTEELSLSAGASLSDAHGTAGGASLAQRKERRTAVFIERERVLDRNFAAQTHLFTQISFADKKTSYSTFFRNCRTIHHTNKTTGKVAKAVSIPLLNPVASASGYSRYPTKDTA